MGTSLRRGFKSEAEWYASEFRKELNLGECSPLHGKTLAEHLDVKIWYLSRYIGIPDDIKLKFATEAGAKQFGGTILFDGPKRHVLINDFVHENRQNSTIMHELSHVILLHPPVVPFSFDGQRQFDNDHEREAETLGFTLLIPRNAALSAIEDFASLEIAAKHFGVSESALRFRIRMTAADVWAKNRAAKRVA